MKICCMSDFHGDLINIEPCNLVLICGDSVPLDIQSNSNKTKKWYFNTFKEWAENLPCNKVIFIAGNHELRLPGHQILYSKEFPKDSKVTYLCNEEYLYEFEGKEYRIFGTPYCRIFGNWAFMYPDKDLEYLYNMIPENLDILITHDQPYGYGDILIQENCPWANGEHIGNIQLAKAIEKKQPVYQFNGHLHSCSKRAIKIGNTTHYNVSVKNEYYEIAYEPLYLEI